MLDEDGLPAVARLLRSGLGEEVEAGDSAGPPRGLGEEGDGEPALPPP